MSEHITALFEGQDLSEEFKVKASAIIATAIDEQRVEIETRLQEESEAKLQARIAELEEHAQTYIQEEVLPTVDKYLSAAVAEWLTENKVKLEDQSKVDLAESFMTGLVGLAKSQNLVIPEGQNTVVADLEGKLSGLKDSFNLLTDRNIELQVENKEFKRKSIIDSVTSALSESQKEKIVTVGAKVDFVDEAQYTEAVKSLVESYFPVEADKGDLNEGDKTPLDVKPLGESYASKLLGAVL